MTDEERKARARERARIYREKNPEKVREIRRLSMQKYRDNNPEKSSAYQRDWEAAHKEQRTATRTPRDRKYYQTHKSRLNQRMVQDNRKRKRCFSPELFDSRRQEQGNLCAICRCKLIGSRQTHADHCHATNVPRGVLCRSCNLALGFMKDDPTRLRAAAEYLEKWAMKTA